jgi:hypothetical protein
VVVKTLALYTIMVTGCIWEKVVFGQYLFAPAFYLGRRVQHAGAGPAHRLPGGAGTGALDAAARCCWRWRPMPAT